MMTMTHCQDQILTENIWFVWSETSYSGDKKSCHQAGQRTNKKKDSATQPLHCRKAEFRKMSDNNVSLIFNPVYQSGF